MTPIFLAAICLVFGAFGLFIPEKVKRIAISLMSGKYQTRLSKHDIESLTKQPLWYIRFAGAGAMIMGLALIYCIIFLRKS